MTQKQFLDSLEEDQPSIDNLALQALWWERKGNWEKAHDLAQDDSPGDGDWVHAYLHRVEGDEGNARYWYARSGKKVFKGPLGEEWSEMVASLLADR